MEPSSDISIESIDENVQKSLTRVRKRKKQLYTDLKKQIEFYLSDANLRKDRYFGHLMQTNNCISIETFLNCNKIKNLTTNAEDVIKAIESSNIVAVSDCKTNIFRIKPVEEKQPEDIEHCTIYIEQLPLKADHDWVKLMFEKYGSVVYVSLPKFKNGTIKRFAFVEFDNKESANKVLEEYKKLHEESKILPEELQSIITFNEEEKGEGGKDTHKSTVNTNLVKKRKHSNSNEGVKEKKMKKDTLKVSSTTIKSNINNKKKKKKDKHKKSNIDSEQKNSSIEISDNENNQIIECETNIESTNYDSLIKKKRKRNKGKKVKSDATLTSSGLRIMSKTEWKKLRNQYLTMQRQKMSLLKAQLRHPKYRTIPQVNLYENHKGNVNLNTNTENANTEKPQKDIRVKYEPGVILKISFSNPIESDKTFKVEAKTDPSIKFVDVINNLEAYVRCDCSETAKMIAEENRWPQTSQLKGEEEKLYWEKIAQDREIKCTKQKGTNKQRGRTKLIKRAEKILAHHVKFEEEHE